MAELVVRCGSRVCDVGLRLMFCASQSPERAFVVRVSYLEIYNNQLTDLLSKSGTRENKVFSFSILFSDLK